MACPSKLFSRVFHLAALLGLLSLLASCDELKRISRMSQSATPAISSVSESAVAIDTPVTLVGSNLDQASYFVGEIELQKLSQSPVKVTLVSNRPVAGELRARKADGLYVNLARTVTVFMPLLPDGLSVTESHELGTVTLTGKHLSAATSIAVSGVAAAIIHKSDDEIVFTVPEGSSSGTVILTSANQRIQVGHLTVLAESSENTDPKSELWRGGSMKP